MLLNLMLSKQKLFELISNSLKISEDEISFDSKINHIEEWDSLGHITIMFAIDKATKGKASKIVKLNDSNGIEAIYKLLKKNNLAE